MIVVPDASAIGAFLLPDEGGAFADVAREACRTHPLHVPPHWYAEIANLLWKAHRRRRIDAGDLARASRVASMLGSAAFVAPNPAIERIVDIATLLNLSAYDSCYLLLARDLAGTLLTGDGPLRRAADAHGVPVIAP